jgi:peptide deformylase
MHTDETTDTTQKSPTMVLPTLDKLPLLPFYHPLLRQKPPAFDFSTSGDLAPRLVALLQEKMKQVNVVGLSANQVMLPFRMFVIGSGDEYKAFFNPEIRTVSRDTSLMEEGCITMPEFLLTLSRPERVNIRFQDETGEWHENTYGGVTARVILHEYDHMEGKNFTVHASNFKLKWELNKYKNRMKKQAKQHRGATHAG